MKIVVLDGYTENPGDLSWDALATLGEFTVYDRTPEDLVIERISDADVVLSNKTVITEEIMRQCPSMKYIGVLATGYNVIDVKAANQLGITVTNVPSYGTDAVAQFTIAQLLELCHHIGEHSNQVKRGEWTKSPDFCFWSYPLIELAGKTLGIIGFGKIGQATAKIAKALGMKILTYNRSTIGKELLDENLRQVSFEELLADSDVISLHCPLFPETKGMINKETIGKMKEGVLLINNARGQLIVEEDLKKALVSGKVAGAALDVVSVEPIQMDNPLLSAPNVIITPHIAWAPKESRQRLMDIAVENLRSFQSGSSINIVK